MAQLDLSVLGLRRAAGLVAALALAGCALKTPPAHTDIVDEALPKETRIPSGWRTGSTAGEVTNGWLQSLGDPALEPIVAEAIANNLDLRVAAARVAIAQQTVVVVGSRLLPWVGAQTGASSAIRREDGKSEHTDSAFAYAAVSWEIDLWGRLRAQRAAAEAGYEATALDYAYARQSIAATTAKLWYLSIETRQLLALAERSVRIYGELLALVEIRRRAGKDSDLDVVDTRAKLETAQGELEQARISYGEARRALEVLLGRYPAAEIEIAAVYPALVPLPGSGIPAALLERRPDLLAAERTVLEAFRREEATELALLPSFSLSLAGSTFGEQLLNLLHFNPWLAAISIGATIPIYEGGALRARIRIATAQQAEAVARYGAVVLEAFREVENSLASEQLLALKLPFDLKSFEDRLAAVRIATIQYKAGRRDLLWVAQLQAAALDTDAQLIKLRGLQRANRVRLHLALGGSFDATPAATLQPVN